MQCFDWFRNMFIYILKTLLLRFVVMIFWWIIYYLLITFNVQLYIVHVLSWFFYRPNIHIKLYHDNNEKNMGKMFGIFPSSHNPWRNYLFPAIWSIIFSTCVDSFYYVLFALPSFQQNIIPTSGENKHVGQIWSVSTHFNPKTGIICFGPSTHYQLQLLLVYTSNMPILYFNS